MRANQANRAVIAARTTQTPVHRAHGTVGTNPALRPGTVVTESGHVRRSRAVKMTGAQRNSLGHPSEWNRPVDYFTDPAWDQTVSRPA